MFNINDFTIQTPVLALQKAMQEVRNSIEASFEDQLFIAMLTAVQGKGSDDSMSYLSELIDINAHTKKCLIDPSLVESLSKKGFLSAIRKNRQFWCDVLQGNILKFEVEDRINDLKAKLCMHNRSLLELCMLRLEAEKAQNAEKLAEAQRLADAKQARKEKRLKEKQLLEAKLAEEQHQQDLKAQSEQVRIVNQQVQAKLEEAFEEKRAEYAERIAEQIMEHREELARLASPDGILSLIEKLDEASRQELLAQLAAKYAPAPTKRGKGTNTQPTLPV